MPMIFSRALVALVLLLPAASALAQVGSGTVSYGAAGATENFNSLGTAGTTNNALPSGWYFAETGSNANLFYSAADGSGASASGDTYSFGTTGNAERSFGGILSGSLVPLIGVRITNNSGSTLAQLPVEYAGEQWRLGTLARPDRLDFQYSLNAAAINDAAATWVNVDALDFTGPVSSGTVGGLDGNAAANRATISATLSGLNLGIGAVITMRWVDFTASGADDGLAIDDVVFGTPTDNPPTVASSVPSHTTIDVPVDTSFSITFSEEVDVLSSAWFTFSCGAGTPTLTASAGPATTFTLTPSGPLGYSKLCNLTVLANQVRDRDGTADFMAFNEQIQFETVADNLPEVLATTPIDLAADVARAANLSVTFSEPVTAPASAFALQCPVGSARAFALSSDDATVFVLDPTLDLPASTPCRLSVDNLQITDLDGVFESPDRNTDVNFTTAALAPPIVVSTVPAKNATNFPSAGDLEVTFDVSVTLDPGAFSLTCAQSPVIVLTHASSGSHFVIDTGTALVAGDTCTLNIEADAVTSGDALHPDADESVPFTVAGGVTPYYAQVNASSEQQLRCSVHETIKGHTFYPYGWPQLEIADEDPNNSGKILDIYRNCSFLKVTNRDSGVAGSGVSATCGTGGEAVSGLLFNREHVWPNSLGFANSSLLAYTDLHMLHLSDKLFNAHRGNKPYAYCTQASGCTEDRTITNNGDAGGNGTYPGNSNWYTASTDGANGSYEVWHRWRGNMARAIFYMAMRYEGITAEDGHDGDIPNLELTDNRSLIVITSNSAASAYMGLLTVLLEWHTQDPVDAREVERNEVVFGFQANRNPFVDHPEWATSALFLSTQPAGCTLGAANAAPVAVDDLYQAIQGTLLTVSGLDGVLDNDTDAEANALTAVLIAQARKGTVALAVDGGFTYQPNVGTCGTDTFTYQAADAQARSSVAIASLNVACGGNQPPVANDATFSLAENSAATTVVGTVSASDPDVGNTLTYAITAGNGAGAFSMSGNQVVVANATPLNFEVTPQFVLTVTASDGSLSDTAQVTINLSNVNEAPVANDATFGVAENSFATTVVGQVVASDVDAGTTLGYSITAGNGSGAFTISAAGQISVANATPLNFETTPQFVLTVTVTDNAAPVAATDTATITISLSNAEEGPAQAANDAAGANEDGGQIAVSVLANDTPDPDGDALAVIGVNDPANGAASFTASGVSYTPDANFCGNDTFDYQITGNISATITVTVACVNDAPTTVGSLPARSAQEGVAIASFSVAGGFNDIDAGDDLDYGQTGLPAGLTLDAESGTVSGTPSFGSAAGSVYAVTITATDGGGLTAQQSFQYSVTSAAPDDPHIFGSGFEG